MLPNEPEIIDAKLAFPDAQRALAGVPEPGTAVRSTVGWYGTSLHPDRGCFAIVREDGPLADLVGDRLRVTYNDKSVTVYCIGARTIDSGEDIVITRRSWAAVELLSMDRIVAVVDVVAGP